LCAIAVVDGDKVITDVDKAAAVKVIAEVIEQYKGLKQIVFKFEKRKSYKKLRGHRQNLTRVRILSIGEAAKPAKAAKAAKAEESAEKPAEAQPEAVAEKPAAKPAAKKAAPKAETAANPAAKPAAKKATPKADTEAKPAAKKAKPASEDAE
ncbi:MAG: bL21 family ribosomal protein, partial [Eggerthellaceae bacterium]|nr:bL21 family ribosomal protein [Eggerthellaceae bacterium]